MISFSKLVSTLILSSQCLLADPHPLISCFDPSDGENQKEQQQSITHAMLDQQTAWKGLEKQRLEFEKIASIVFPMLQIFFTLMLPCRQKFIFLFPPCSLSH